MIIKQSSTKLRGVVLAIVCLLSINSMLSKNYLGYYLEDDFDTAMIGPAKDIADYQNLIAKTPDKFILRLIKHVYHDFINSLDELYHAEPRIPKIIHQIWVGPHPFPQEARKWQETWLQLHPDWEYKLWTNVEVELFEFENKKYYDQAENWGEKADILRYEIIHKFGGLYADIDQSCLKAFDVLHHTSDFYAGVHSVPLMVNRIDKLRIANGVFAAKPGHPILKFIIEQIKNNRTHYSLLYRTGPDFFTQMITQKLESSRAQGNVDVILPANYFYPCGQRLFEKVFSIDPDAYIYIKPETLGVQYYTSYWVKPPK